MSASPTAEKPNVLFLFTDDQRFDTVAALGNPDIRTPNLDALAERGTVFTNAHIMGGTSAAVCMPSRAMLHSGRNLFHLDRQGQAIPDDHALMGEHFRRAGYRTFGTGKWHNGTKAFARSFTDGGQIFFGGMFDHWNVPACDFDPTGKYESRFPVCVSPATTNEVRWQSGDHVAAGKHSTELFCDEAIRFLGEAGDEPFFMYVSFMAPHDPRTMPQKYLEMYDPDDIPLPPSFMGAHPFNNGELKIRDELLEDWPRTPEAIRRHIAEYYAMITHVDAEIGRVLDELKRTGQYDNTVIVFGGDNGLAVGRHGLMGKQSLYEHSVGVPLMFAGPGVPAGRRTEAFAYLHDIFPTLCDLCGLEIPDAVESQSLAPVIAGDDAAARDTLLFAYRDVQRGARDERWKLIEYVVEGRRTTQLFDLKEDPWELSNLAARPDCAEHVARLRRQVRRWRDELDDTSDAFWDAFVEDGE